MINDSPDEQSGNQYQLAGGHCDYKEIEHGPEGCAHHDDPVGILLGE